MRNSSWIWAALLALPLAPALAQGPIETPGTVTHRAADAHFPERVGEFQRVQVTQFDGQGNDIGASYVLERGPDQVLVTVYVYPSARMGRRGSREARCEEEFQGVGAAIATHNRSARRVEDIVAPAVEGVEPSLAHRAVYRMEAAFDGRQQPVRSEAYLYCFVGGEWQVKYRATSNAAFDASADIERLIRTGPWPGRAAPVETDKIAALSAATAG